MNINDFIHSTVELPNNLKMFAKTNGTLHPIESIKNNDTQKCVALIISTNSKSNNLLLGSSINQLKLLKPNYQIYITNHQRDLHHYTFGYSLSGNKIIIK